MGLSDLQIRRAEMKEKMLRWTVEFSVAESWVADGFDLTTERALDMLANDLRYANTGTELDARVVKAPNKNTIKKIQGY